MASRFFCTISKTSLKGPSGECYEKTMNAETKARLIERVKSLEGLTNDERSALLELLRTEKAYGLVWENKPEDVEERLRDELPVLVEDETKRIISDSPDAPNHALIEGDNLEALTTLAYTHAGKIDVIYIDPPYNTGNKDFVYNDAFVDSEDAYRHSKWLSFMSKRLRIAKKLLSDCGVIFISIDDNEQANLKLLCDDVFSEKNFIAQLIWQKKKGGGNDSKYVATEHEYVLLYAKNTSSLNNIFIPYGQDYLSRYKEKDSEGRFFWDTFKRKSGKQYYPIQCPDGSILQYEENGEPISWLRSEPRFLSDLKKGEARIIKVGEKWTVHFKQRQPAGYKPRSLMNDVGTTSSGADKLKDIFNKTHVFENPKPNGLIEFLLKFGSESSNVLDFFAGSGTTLHAVMQLNAEDGGQRQCILVTNNENGICENVTYERNKRVINGYTKPNGDHVEGLHANNLRYYRTAYVPREPSHQVRKEQARALTDLLCIKENVYDEKKAFGGLSLAGKEQLIRYFADDARQMLLIYDTRVVPHVVNEIAKMPDGVNVKIYVFADGSYPYTADFESVLNKITLVAMPYSMNKALHNVLPVQDDVELNDKPESEED